LTLFSPGQEHGTLFLIVEVPLLPGAMESEAGEAEMLKVST
jgi:hypothetical protein